MPTRLIVAALLALGAGAAPLSVHPENPHYFLFRGRPVVLITSGEHYGAVINADFDYRRYLDTLQSQGFNLTRVFPGSYWEVAGSFHIAENTLAPMPDRFLCPWPRTAGGKFDLSRWNEALFTRLADFVREAGKRGIVVEVSLFTPMYEDQLWEINPMNARNNINGIGRVKRTEALTLTDPALFAAQQKLVRRVVGTLRDCDNVYYEICNEPYFAGVTREWQDGIAQTIHDAEAAFPGRHIISENIANNWKRIERPNPLVSLFNFHYARPPRAVEMNWDVAKPIGNNETGFDGTGDDTYRIQAWDFLHAGGALFNHLDYSFTVGHEDGTFQFPETQPGGGGPALRRSLTALVRHMGRLDYLHMSPAGDLVRATPPGASVRALAQPGRLYSIYVHHAAVTGEKKNRRFTPADGPGEIELELTLPAGGYRAEWSDPRTGTALRTEDLGGGAVRARSPHYRRDIVLRLEAIR